MFNDNEQFIQQFLIETEEHLESIENNLISLEKNFDPKNFDIEYVNELFRSIHTIKGLSGMLEFNNLFNLTHLWENVLDQVRKRSNDLSKEIIDVSFQGLDILNQILESIKQSGSDSNISINSVLLTLEKISNRKSGNTEDSSIENTDLISYLSKPIQNTIMDFEKNKLITELENNKTIYEIVLHLNKDCFEKDISYISTCINLEFLGEIINISPNIFDVPELENFKAEDFDLEIFILFASDKDIERIQSILKNREIRVNKISFDGEIVDNTSNFSENKYTEIATEEVKAKTEEPKKSDFNFDISKLKEQNEKKDSKQKQKQNKVLVQDTIRVETSRLDILLALLGEQVISKTQLEHLCNFLNEMINENEGDYIPKNKINEIYDKFNEKINTLSRLSNEIQTTVMRIRMLPIGNVFNRFSRVVRDLAKELGKEVELIIDGEETELDKTIIEEISDPLMHIIRNAIDHGIERPEERLKKGKNEYGSLWLNAYQQGNSIVITIRDDGRGLNIAAIRQKGLEKGLITNDMQLTQTDIINLILEPGFSTAEQVTGISGRGVGMDVVKQNITNLKGTIDIDTKENEGTTFIIKLPLTLAIIQSLLVNVNENTYAIPLNSVIESYRASQDEIRLVNNKPVLKLRDKILPILYFQDYFKLEKFNPDREFFYVVIIGVAEYRVGFVVDKLVGQKEIVIKPLNDPLVKIRGIGGATLLGEDITLIIDTVPIVLDSQSGKRYEKAVN